MVCLPLWCVGVLQALGQRRDAGHRHANIYTVQMCRNGDLFQKSLPSRQKPFIPKCRHAGMGCLIKGTWAASFTPRTDGGGADAIILAVNSPRNDHSEMSTHPEMTVVLRVDCCRARLANVHRGGGGGGVVRDVTAAQGHAQADLEPGRHGGTQGRRQAQRQRVLRCAQAHRQ